MLLSTLSISSYGFAFGFSHLPTILNKIDLKSLDYLNLTRKSNIRKRKGSEKGPASNGLMEFDNEVFFLRSEAVVPEIRPKVISPSQSTTLPTSIQPFEKRAIFIQIPSLLDNRRNKARERTERDLLSWEPESNSQLHGWKHKQGFWHLPLQSKALF